MPPVDEFRFVSREHAGLDESYLAPSGTEPLDLRGLGDSVGDALTALTASELPFTLESDVVPALEAERAALERHLRRPVPRVATREELLAFALRDMKIETPPSPPRISAPGGISLLGAFGVLRENTVAAVRGGGVPLGPGWREDATLLDSRLATTIVYVGPGFAAMFGPTGKLVGTPFGTSWRVASAPNPGGLSTGGVFFSIKIDLGARGIQEWVLPLWPSGEAFRVIDFGPRLVELTPSMRAGLRKWMRESNRGLITVVSPSYWHRRGILDALSGAPRRLWLVANRCLEEGYFADAVEDLGGQLAKMDLGDVARMIVDLLPGALDQAGRLGHAAGMGVWGDENGESDIDVAARLLAPPAAELLFGMVVAKVAHRVWKAAKGEKVPKGEAPPERAIEEPAIEDGRPTDASRALDTEPPVTPPLAAALADAMAALATRGFLVAAAEIVNAGVHLGRAGVQALKGWFEGELYSYRDGLYLIADRLRDQAIRISLALDDWAFGRQGGLFMNPGGALFDALARRMYRLVLELLGRDTMTAREAQVLSRLDPEAWKRVMEYGQRGATPVDSVKGKLQEELIFLTPEFERALELARDLAELEGFPRKSVRFIRNVRGKTGKPRGHRYEIGELTDGIIAAVDNVNGVLIVRIYDVFESKSPSNLRSVVVSRGGDVGQLAKDLERFHELPTEIDGDWFEPDQVVVSRHSTQWWVFEPGEKGLTVRSSERLSHAFPKFRSIVAPVRSSVLQRVARAVQRIVGSQ